MKRGRSRKQRVTMDRLLAHNCPLIGAKVWLLERLEPLTTVVGVAYYILTQSFSAFLMLRTY